MSSGGNDAPPGEPPFRQLEVTVSSLRTRGPAFQRRRSRKSSIPSTRRNAPGPVSGSRWATASFGSTRERWTCGPSREAEPRSSW